MDSNKYTSEDSKRKREQEKPKDIFRKSKKINRMLQREKQDKEER